MDTERDAYLREKVAGILEDVQASHVAAAEAADAQEPEALAPGTPLMQPEEAFRAYIADLSGD